jgi:hypothetical protein
VIGDLGGIVQLISEKNHSTLRALDDLPHFSLREEAAIA